MADDSSMFDHILGGKFLFTATGADRLISRTYDAVLDKIGDYVPETVKAGLVSDYGLEEQYLDRKADMKAAEAAQARKTAGLVETLAGLTHAESCGEGAGLSGCHKRSRQPASRKRLARGFSRGVQW